MRKSTKIAMLVAAIVLLASLTVFAKGWKQDDYGWYYEDAYGMMEYLKWEKSGDNYYYLGEDGYMATNALVQDSNGAKYWVGADGAKVVNTWVQVPADDYDQETYEVEYRWYRFGSTGKAVTTNWTDAATGKKYFFDNDGKMLFGYHDGVQIISTSTPFNGSIYYCGSNDDGAMVKDIWYRIDVTDQEAYDEVTFKWVYYKSNGKKATSETNGNGLVWKNQRYFFDAQGRMLYSFNDVSVSVASTQSAYMSTSDDGHMVKKAWVYKAPELDSDEAKHWYYFDAAGKAIADPVVKKINGKYYAFCKGDTDDKAARMQVGFVEIKNIDAKDAITAGEATKKIDTTAMTVEEWKAAPYTYVFYFSGDEANDGSLKKSITVNNVEFFDDYANIIIDKTGKVANGLYNSRYYMNGILLAASVEERYAVVEVAADTYKLLSTSGTAVKSGVAIDGDGNYYIVKTENKVEKIYKVSNYLDYAVRAAQAVNSAKAEFVADGDTYVITKAAAAVDGVYEVTYSLKK